MSPTKDSRSLADLLTRYLEEQITAHGHGLGYSAPAEQVTPFEAAPVQPIDPRLAWQEAIRAGAYFSTTAVWSVPPGWPSLVQQQEPAIAVPFCLGNYPQMVRHLPLLLDAAGLTSRTSGPLSCPELVNWAESQREEPLRYLAAAMLRLSRQFNLAEQLLAGAPSEGFRELHGNEVAALAWARGERAEAMSRWQALPETLPVWFNRGMAGVFLGQKALAVPALEQAVRELPESSAWHHLGQLYRTLAEMR